MLVMLFYFVNQLRKSRRARYILRVHAGRRALSRSFNISYLDSLAREINRVSSGRFREENLSLRESLVVNNNNNAKIITTFLPPPPPLSPRRCLCPIFSFVIRATSSRDRSGRRNARRSEINTQSRESGGATSSSMGGKLTAPGMENHPRLGVGVDVRGPPRPCFARVS